jgi:hypothetical protein
LNLEIEKRIKRKEKKEEIQKEGKIKRTGAVQAWA